MGLASYFDVKNLGGRPSGEANLYGYPIFTLMMFTKALCVLYVSLLDHAVLFQDVHGSSVVQRPIGIFSRARWQWTTFLQSILGQLWILLCQSEQKDAVPLHIILISRCYGTQVKKSLTGSDTVGERALAHEVNTFERGKTDMFPSGFHYHQDWDEMHKIVKGEAR